MRVVRSSIARLLSVVVVTAALAACGENPTAPLAYAPFSSEDLQGGTGDTAASGNLLTVNYRVWLYDAAAVDTKGPLVDSSVGKDPFKFTLGTGAVIEGWDQGLPGMQEGGKRRLVVPPSLAYGGTRNGRIPPDSTLVFEIELIDVS